MTVQVTHAFTGTALMALIATTVLANLDLQAHVVMWILMNVHPAPVIMVEHV